MYVCTFPLCLQVRAHTFLRLHSLNMLYSLVTHARYLTALITTQSSIPFIPLPYALLQCCPCGADIPLQFILATNPRNAGRPYYAVRLLTFFGSPFTDHLLLQCVKCRNWYQWDDGLGNLPCNSPTTSPTIDQGKSPGI